jgi:hypothetical protein
MPDVFFKRRRVLVETPRRFKKTSACFRIQKTAGAFLSCRHPYLLDANSPGTNWVVINELIKHPTNQSFYL